MKACIAIMAGLFSQKAFAVPWDCKTAQERLVKSESALGAAQAQPQKYNITIAQQNVDNNRSRVENCERALAEAVAKEEAQRVGTDTARGARIQEQTRLADQASAQRRREEEREARVAKDPKALALIFGAQLCYDARIRSGAKSEIAKELKYARLGGGVINQQRVYAWQYQMRRADELDVIAREAMSRTAIRFKPLGCKSPMVAMVLRCVIDEDCEVGDDAVALEALRYAASQVTTMDEQ